MPSAWRCGWCRVFAVLAILALSTGIIMLATGQWLFAVACLVCALVFVLESLGVETLGRTRKALERLYQERRG